MLGGIILTLIKVRKHDGTGLLLVWYPWSCITIIIIRHCLLAGKSLYLGSVPLIVVFIFQVVQYITPLFMGQGTIVRIFFIHIILYGYWYTVLC